MDADSALEHLRSDFPLWAERYGKIVDKNADLIPFKLKAGQLELDRALEAQRADGRPRRAIILKARQLGFSTYTQGKLIHECTLRERVNAAVVAHDTKTGEKLYEIGERLYSHLPNDDTLKPKHGRHRRTKYLHFAGDTIWHEGQAYPDSTYSVDTAGEYESGRGITPTRMHLSEVAFWPQVEQKLTALLQGVPDTPDSLVILESTANGYNAFKDRWDDAVAGRSGYIPFFWAWWQDPEYSRPFISDAERESFVVGDPANPYAEREPELVEQHGLSVEQLHWRRRTIADKCGGDLRVFDQEYPTIPEDAFIATGQKVFDPYRVKQLVERVKGEPPPQIGDLKAGSTREQFNRVGERITIPASALWVPRQRGIANPEAPFKLWLPEDAKPSGDYVIAVDVSGGNTESTRDPDYHAIQVIDHKSREQVAQYRSRIEPERLAELILLTALHFNEAWVAIERTGGWGQGVQRILYLDYRYTKLYRPKQFGRASEKSDTRFGWDTNQRTKPELVSGMAGLLLEGVDGIRDKDLADEVQTYTRNEKGATEAEPGRYDDLLMAYMIAQQVARELPMQQAVAATPGGRSFRVGAGLGAYDRRY